MPERGRRRTIDAPRRTAFDALRRIHSEDAYANLVTQALTRGMDPRDAGFVIELVHGTCRMEGTWDAIIETASRRGLNSMQPAVVDVLRMAAHQLFAMSVPTHAAVATSVNLAGVTVGERVTGLVNAVVRRLAAHPLDAWLDRIAPGTDHAALGLRHAHPRWIVEALDEALDHRGDLVELLVADNQPPVPMLVARPGLCERDELIASGATAARWSPWGASRPGDPLQVAAIVEGRAGVQDEGSQLVIQAATSVDVPAGPWLDLCAGPGGKSGLLRGLSPSFLVAAELQPHRAGLVAQNLRAYPAEQHQVIACDGTRPAWGQRFALTVADVPCSGLGALRRRPESRWRRNREVISELTGLQERLLATAISSTIVGGVIAYITCSPHLAETVDIVATARDVEILDAPSHLPQVSQAAHRTDSRFIQLWPHLHGTDAMFCALLRRVS